MDHSISLFRYTTRVLGRSGPLSWLVMAVVATVLAVLVMLVMAAPEPVVAAPIRW